ncbi:MAG: zinc-dependent metalloprotease, partial [Persicimonas sp.]
YVQDDSGQSRDAPLFDYESTNEGDQLAYFDVTNRIHARAGTVEYPGYGQIPTCWLFGGEFKECGASEYAIRNSFKRIDPDHEYVPMPYKGKETEVFGFFTTERMVYDNKESIRYQRKKRYLNRHNLWETWYAEDGSLLDPSERELRPIVYHVNVDMPDDLVEISQKVADQWNEIYNDVVEAQGYELADGERTFILCPNNPIEEGDPAECGEPGDSPRLGDIRYSFMAYVPEFMDYGLLGLGPANNDPETGEIISGMAYVYHWNDVGAYRTQEMVELLNGTREPDQYVEGLDLTSWIEQVDNPQSSPRRTVDLQQNEPFVQDLATRYKGERMAITAEDERKQREEGFDAFIEDKLDTLYRRSNLNGENRAPEGRLSQLEGSYIEDLMVNDEILAATGHDPNTEVTDYDMKMASVVRGGFAKQAQVRAELREKFAAERNMYLPEMADDALMGLAEELKDEDMNSEEVYNTIREAVYTAVLAHEVGHSLGLMHNFAGSEDAVNYHDEYWHIRDDGNVGPRLEDPITEDEINDKIYNEAYSSIMDYAGRYTIDGQGVGKYDRAAILYGYAGKIEVFKDRGGVEHTTFRDWFDQSGEILNFGQFQPSATHYTTLYNEMGDLLYRDDNRMLVDVADLKVDEHGSRDWSTAVVGDEEYSRVPYIYCSHANYNLGDSCLTRDHGADSYERMKNMLDDLNTWYISRSFPRGAIGRNYWNYVGANYGRIYNRIKRWHDLYGLYAELLPQFYSESRVESFFTDPVNGWGGKSWAVKNAFNYLMQTLMTPDVGQYQKRELVDGTTMLTDPMTAVDAELDVTQGRYYATSWSRGEDGTRECGYFWSECLNHVGFYLDKIMAIEALTDTSTNFVARATPEDIREWEVGYFNTFGDQLLELNDALMRENYEKVGPYLNDDGEMEFPDYTGDLQAVNDDVIDPYTTFTIQLYWQVLGQARFPDSYDHSFLETSRLWIRGMGNAPEIQEEYLVTFKDPWSGYVYEASNNGDEYSAAEGVINRANMLLRMTDKCDDDGSTPETVDDCEAGVDESTQAEAERELRDYMELMKAIAYITPVFSHGNPYSP